MPLSILFVDDEPLILRAFQRDFAGVFNLSVASSAAEAAELLTVGRHYDVVVIDVTMPGMDGITFIERKAPEFPGTRFVLLTGNCDSETFERASRLGAVHRVLSKPAGHEEIAEAIADAAAQTA